MTEQQTLDDMAETTAAESIDNEVDSTADQTPMDGGIDLLAELQKHETDEQEESGSVLREYIQDIEPNLIEEGWHIESAKSVEHGKAEQPLINHVRNGVFILHQLNNCTEELLGKSQTPQEFREVVALFIIHDIHKIFSDTETPRHKEFDISQEDVETYVEALGLDDFAPELSIEEFHSCAIDHENRDNARTGVTTGDFNSERVFIRFADGFASCETLSDAVAGRMQTTLRETYPKEGLKLYSHRINRPTGLFTNIVNKVIADRIVDNTDAELLAIYENGCVYLGTTETDFSEPTDAFFQSVYRDLQKQISESHPSYNSPDTLQEGFGSSNKGYYKISPESFFYAGPDDVLKATVIRGVYDSDTDEDLTDNMLDYVEIVEDTFGVTITHDKHTYGLQKLVNTIRKRFVAPLIPDGDEPQAMEEVFNLSESTVKDIQQDIDSDDTELGSNAKWEYAYIIAEKLRQEFETTADNTEIDELTSHIVDGLDAISTGWRETVLDVECGAIEGEITTYLKEEVTLNQSSKKPDTETADVFEQYTRKNRTKVCESCGRPSEDMSRMKTGKDLSTLQANFTNTKFPGGNDWDNLLFCQACRLEFSLRDTGSSRRGADTDRIFFHISPDYFYTPLSGEIAARLFAKFSGDEGTRMDRLAEAAFNLEAPKQYNQILDHLASEEGRQMLESVSTGFESNIQYGSMTLSYFKPQDSHSNPTGRQFFGVYLGIVLAAYSSSRIYISSNPIAELQSSDFNEMVRVDVGGTQVTDFIGEQIPLSSLSQQIKRGSALVKLGNKITDGYSSDDSMFPKYLRIMRNEMLPGAHLLKKVVRENPDEGAKSKATLMEYAATLDETAGITSHTTHTEQMTQDTHSIITTVAQQAFDVVRSKSSSDKPYAVERVFRESVKAITKSPNADLSEEDYIAMVSGKIQKMANRENQFYRTPVADSTTGDHWNTRVQTYATTFVETILMDLADGRPSQLKRIENNLADGFYAATLRLQQQQ